MEATPSPQPEKKPSSQKNWVRIQFLVDPKLNQRLKLRAIALNETSNKVCMRYIREGLDRDGVTHDVATLNTMAGVTVDGVVK
jgi:hypothetical protein